MATMFRAETRTTDEGARVEIGIVTFNGRDFTALGSVVDEARGIICAYVSERSPGHYFLTTWEGATIAPLRKVRRTYSGRNSGPEMFIRMKGGAS